MLHRSHHHVLPRLHHHLLLPRLHHHLLLLYRMNLAAIVRLLNLLIVVRFLNLRLPNGVRLIWILSFLHLLHLYVLILSRHSCNYLAYTYLARITHRCTANHTEATSCGLEVATRHTINLVHF